VLGELLSVACFRTAVHIEFRREEVNLLVEEPTSEACKVLTAFNKAFTAQEQSNVRARLVRKASSRLAAASLPNELAESEFDSDEVKAEAKEWEDAEQDRSLAWLRSKHKEEPIHIVNRAYCKELEFVLTTQKSRQELVGMAEFIALGTCAQWFDTSSLDEDPIAASTACLQAWLDAVMAAIQDKELLPRLERAKESFEKQHREFFPWVIVKSLCALAIQIDGQTIMQQTTPARSTMSFVCLLNFVALCTCRCHSLEIEGCFPSPFPARDRAEGSQRKGIVSLQPRESVWGGARAQVRRRGDCGVRLVAVARHQLLPA
jgi:hypothetical protein